MNTVIKSTLAASALVVVAACGSSGSSAGSFLNVPTAKTTNFNDPDFLATDVAKVIDAKQTDGSTVDVTCIHVSGTQFTCIGVWSDGSPNSTATVTVAKDGQSWISS